MKELDAMEIGAIRQFITHLWARFNQAPTRCEKSKIIDAVQLTLGYHRKSIIRLLSSPHTPELRRKSGNRKPKYTEDDIKWLVRIWRAMGKICSERIVAALEDWIPALCMKLGLPKRVAEKLLQMSASTMDRKLASFRSKERRKSNTGTVPSLYTEIPIKPLGIKVDAPGVIEVDTVAHCGGTLSGTFAWTVTATDIYTGTTFCRAVWGKSAAAVVEALKVLEERFPFPVHTFWFDNGTEFINDTMLETFTKREDFPINVARSRPYKKNDQAHVEEKNWTHVRQLFGNERIDSKKAISTMNQIYNEASCPLHNFYLPQTKTLEKYRVGAKIKRVIDKPRTPMWRLIQTQTLSEFEIKKLEREKAKADPLDLKRKLDLLFSKLRRELGSRVYFMPKRFTDGYIPRPDEDIA